VIRSVCADDQHRRRLIDKNPWLEEAFAVDSLDIPELLRQNTQTIDRQFSPGPSGRRLIQLYEQVSGSVRGRDPRPLMQRERILDELLSPRRFRMIRT
jgi:hypothetical protein